MKTPEEILKMTKAEVQKYKWSNDLNLKEDNKDCFHCSDCFRCSDCSYCSDCFHCSDCSYCSDCFHCSDCFGCYGCRNAEGLKYAICNVEVGKEAYEKWMNENGLTPKE